MLLPVLLDIVIGFAIVMVQALSSYYGSEFSSYVRSVRTVAAQGIELSHLSIDRDRTPHIPFAVGAVPRFPPLPLTGGDMSYARSKMSPAHPIRRPLVAMQRKKEG